MSTDLHDLPKPPQTSTSSSSSAVKIELPTDQNDRATTLAATIENGRGYGGDIEEERCRTPTSKESRIPEVLTCPPAPRKAKRVVSCKRKLLDEFQMLEKKIVVNKDEIDGFFRSTFPKRTCRCT